MSPVHDHDCDACHFLGTDIHNPGEPQCNCVDLYICTQSRQPDDYALIRRYGSEPSNYGCMPVTYAGDRYANALLLAKEKGYVK